MNTPTDIMLRRIAKERLRVLTTTVFCEEHDDHHNNGELLLAASAYVIHAHAQAQSAEQRYFKRPTAATSVMCIGATRAAETWPWDAVSFKPSPDPMRNLEKAGQLIVAEMERLERQSAAQSKEE